LAKTRVLTEEQQNARTVKFKTILAATIIFLMVSAIVITAPTLWENAQNAAATAEPVSKDSAGFSPTRLVIDGVIVAALAAGWVWVIASVTRR